MGRNKSQFPNPFLRSAFPAITFLTFENIPPSFWPVVPGWRKLWNHFRVSGTSVCKTTIKVIMKFNNKFIVVVARCKIHEQKPPTSSLGRDCGFGRFVGHFCLPTHARVIRFQQRTEWTGSILVSAPHWLAVCAGFDWVGLGATLTEWCGDRWWGKLGTIW